MIRVHHYSTGSIINLEQVNNETLTRLFKYEMLPVSVQDAIRPIDIMGHVSAKVPSHMRKISDSDHHAHAQIIIRAFVHHSYIL